MSSLARRVDIYTAQVCPAASGTGEVEAGGEGSIDLTSRSSLQHTCTAAAGAASLTNGRGARRRPTNGRAGVAELVTQPAAVCLSADPLTTLNHVSQHADS